MQGVFTVLTCYAWESYRLACFFSRSGKEGGESEEFKCSLPKDLTQFSYRCLDQLDIKNR